jgi:hypothetical protein
LYITPHLRKLLVEVVRHSPVLEIAMIAFKQRGRVVRLMHLIIEKGVLESKGPVKAEVVRIAVRKILGLEDLVVLCDEPVPDGGPREEVESDGMFGAGLCEAEEIN